MPREPKAQEIVEQEVGLSHALARQDKPVVDLKVVYLGSNPKMALSLKGRLVVERVGEGADAETLRTPTGSGREFYDFSSADTRGRTIESRLMPATHPEAIVRGKPYCVVAHPDHLFEMSQMRDGNDQLVFQLVGTPSQMGPIERYIEARLRAQRTTQRTYEMVSA